MDKWGERIKKKCKCGKIFFVLPCFNKRKFCSEKCNFKYRKTISYWKNKKMPNTMINNMRISHKKMWDEGKMDNRKKLLGDLNHSKNPEVKLKIRKSHEKAKRWTPIENLSKWKLYSREITLLTYKYKKELFNKWNGYCFYCNRYILNEKGKKNKFIPTIDHRVSVYFGFHNELNPEFIADIRNLCICCKHCNSSKHSNVR